MLYFDEIGELVVVLDSLVYCEIVIVKQGNEAEA